MTFLRRLCASTLPIRSSTDSDQSFVVEGGLPQFLPNRSLRSQIDVSHRIITVQMPQQALHVSSDSECNQDYK